MNQSSRKHLVVLAAVSIGLATLAAYPARALAHDFSHPETQGRAQDYMCQRINELRSEAGSGPVRLDPVAGEAAQQHAQDMLERGYFSHWNPDGIKPSRRYNLLGGFHALAENIYFLHGKWGSIEDLADEALEKLMDSPGHRKTLLNPAYTHVGLAFAGDPRAGDLYVAQEFITRIGGDYRCPLKASVGQEIEFAGRFDPARYSFENIIIGYEPRPKRRDFAWLSRTGSYKDGDKLVAGYTANERMQFKDLPTYREVGVDTADGWFKSGLRLTYDGKEGLYYIFLWLREKRSGQPVLAATVTVDVTRP